MGSAGSAGLGAAFVSGDSAYTLRATSRGASALGGWAARGCDEAGCPVVLGGWGRGAPALGDDDLGADASGSVFGASLGIHPADANLFVRVLVPDSQGDSSEARSSRSARSSRAAHNVGTLRSVSTAFFSSCRTRSRVTLSSCPRASSVMGSPRNPQRPRRMAAERSPTTWVRLSINSCSNMFCTTCGMGSWDGSSDSYWGSVSRCKPTSGLWYRAMVMSCERFTPISGTPRGFEATNCRQVWFDLRRS